VKATKANNNNKEEQRRRQHVWSSHQRKLSTETQSVYDASFTGFVFKKLKKSPFKIKRTQGFREEKKKPHNKKTQRQ
jgi:hypothetical protein